MKHLLTTVLMLTALSLSAQMENVMLDIPDPGKGLFSGYEWNNKKTIGLTTLILASLADGIVEGYEFDGRKSFERKFGVKPISYSGSESWRLAYKNNDVAQGHKNTWTKFAGASDLYHHLDDLRKFGYISGGIFITLGSKKGKFKDVWKSHLIDFAVYSIASSVSKSAGMRWVRN